MIEEFSWKQGNAEVEVKSNYGDWKDAVKKFKQDEETPIIFLRTVYEDCGECYESFQGLSIDQAKFIVGALSAVVNHLEKNI